MHLARPLYMQPARRTFTDPYNIVVAATNSDDSAALLLRAYLDAVMLSEAVQTQVWHAAEVTLAQVRVLRRLAKQPLSLGQLGADLALAPPSMTRLADRLEERGLIERRRDDEDRRKVLAELTPEGRRLVSAIPSLDLTPLRKAVDGMSVADRERIAAAMREFSAAVMQAEEESLLVETGA
jgi:MarR family transcriptional regulator, transcriptional regulator for hemolysin